jgi:hypothetical protein
MTRECPECGREFDSNSGIGSHMGHMHDGKPWLPEDELRRLYWEEDYSQREIADKFDSSQKVVLEAMRYYGIESEKANNDPTRPPSHSFMSKNETVGTTYEVIQNTHEGNIESVLLHRLIAIAYGKLEPDEYFDPDVVVHHKTGHGLDNRPDNIQVMERGDHQTMHLRERYS